MFSSVAVRCLIKCETKWIHCSICGSKTRTKVSKDTVLVNFPLFCPRCKKETYVDVIKLKMVLSSHKSQWIKPTFPRLCGDVGFLYCCDYFIAYVFLFSLRAASIELKTGIKTAAWRWNVAVLRERISNCQADRGGNGKVRIILAIMLHIDSWVSSA